MKRLYSTNALVLFFAFVCWYTGSLRAQIPIDCHKVYLQSHPNGLVIYSYDPATSTYVVNPISCPAGSTGLAVSNNLNAGFPATTFYTVISAKYWYYNGSSWVNTGHSCSNSLAVNICGAGPYIYNFDALNKRVFRYSGTGTDVLVLTLSNWGGPADLIGDDNGNFYVLYLNSGAQKLVKYSPTGAVLCTYSLVNAPVSGGGAGFAIVGNNLYMNCSAGDYVGTITGNTITFSSLSTLPSGLGDFASCPFPQLTSGINSSNQLNCVNLSSVLTATTNVTGPSYSWSGPGIVSGSGTGTVTVDQPGTYTVVITGSGGTCPGTSTSTISIAQNATPPAGVTATPGGTLSCTSPTVSLSASPASGLSYAWTGPGIVSGANTANPVVDQPGNYSLTVTDTASGCSNTTQVVASVTQNNVVPTASITPADLIICPTPTITLAGSTSANATYNWSGPGIVSGGTTTHAVVNLTGTYVYVVTNTVSGCSDSATVTVSYGAGSYMPSVSSSGNGTLTCVTSSLTLSANPASGFNYSWSGPGVVSGGNTANAVINQAGTYTLIATDPTNGCSNSAAPAVTTVIQNTTAPVVNISTTAGSGSLTCAVSSVTLNTSSAGNYSYSWTGPGIVSGAITANPVVNVPGNYSVTVTNTVTGCSNASGSAGSVVYVPSNTLAPVAVIDAASSGTITCTNTVVTINATASASGPAIVYSWANAGGPMSNSTTNAPTVTASGDYTLTVTDTINGCSNTATVSISSNLSYPTGVSAGTNTVLPCDTTAIVLWGNSSSSAISYAWSGPHGYTFSGQNASGVTAPGAYTVTVTDNVTGCADTAVVLVSLQSVNASFIADQTGGPLPLPVNFTNTSTGGSTYSWIFGDGNTATTFNSSNTYQSPGSYTVVLTVYNSAGTCSDTASVLIVVNEPGLEIPNVFTPNGDQVNDLFTIRSEGIKELSLQIFNRWGEKLYEVTGPKVAWNGVTRAGKPVPDGTYFYFVKATGFNDTVIEKKGTVSLFR